MVEKSLFWQNCLRFTVKVLLGARGFIRIITFLGDGGGPLLDATLSVRKDIKTSCSSNLSLRVAILISCVTKSVETRLLTR